MDRFDLEQEIMSCWNVVEDLKMIYAAEHLYDDEDAMMNALLGIGSLYELKFQKLWNTFEGSISDLKVRDWDGVEKNEPALKDIYV